MTLLRIEAFPDFPTTDLPENTADTLDMLLLNRGLVEVFHTSAEQSLRYRLGHEILARIAGPHFDDADRLDAFSHGISLYEAMAAMIRPQRTDQPVDNATTILGIADGIRALDQAFITTLTDTAAEFRSTLPRTCQAIGHSATRFYGGLEGYVQSGAAIARQLEIQTTSA